MRIGIIGAMDVEVAQLLEAMDIRQEETLFGMRFAQGVLSDADAVVVRCGVGKVNAAVCAAVLCEHFQCDLVINTGVAGALNPELKIGDFLLSLDAVQHDVDASIFGYEKGEVPSSGMRFFKADERLADLAEKVIEDFGGRSIKGRVASGDQFIAEKAKKDWIRETFAADCCDMEGAAIAQACTLADVPFLIVRAISDQADESVSISYDVFEKSAARQCALLTVEILKKFKGRTAL